MKTAKSSLIVCFFCVLLTSCDTISRQDFHSAEAKKTQIKEPQVINSEKTIYLKPFTAHQYPPELMATSQFKKVNSIKKKGKSSRLRNSAFTDLRFQQFSLHNGLQVFLLPRHELPTVNIAVVINAGKHQKNDDDEMLSPLVIKMLKQGTIKYSKEEFLRKTALLGEPMTYRQTSEYSVISSEFLPQDLELVLELLSQQLAHINPDDNSLRKIIEQQLLENKLAQSSGFFLAKSLFYRNNYPHDHLYFYQQPDSEQIKKVSIKKLMDFYQKKYLPGASKIIIVGDINANQLQQQTKNYFSNWSKNNIYEPRKIIKTSYEEQSKKIRTLKKHTPRIDVIDRKDAQQVDVLFGVVTATGDSSDWTGLKMIASILGGGPSSRLFVDLRETKGLAYSISAEQMSGRYQSPFLIQTSVAHDKVVDTIEGISKHLDYLCQHKVDERELRQIKQQLAGEILFKFQTNQQWVNDKIHQLEIGLPVDYIADRLQQINRINPEQLLTLANRYLCGSHNVIIVGDKGKLEAGLLRVFNEYRYQAHSLPLQ